jgi:hypothetical protein
MVLAVACVASPGSAGEVVVDADSFSVPVGIDGEALSLPTPVRCRVRPKALRSGCLAIARAFRYPNRR